MESLRRIKLQVLIVLLVLGAAFPYSLFAQKCPQANITTTNYELRKQDGTPFLITDNYTVGQSLVNGKIFVKLGGSTTSGYNLTMVYDIYVNGVPQILRKQNCLFVATSIVQGVFVEVTDFSWIWGDKIEIKNIFITWETGQPKANTTCKVLTQTDIDGINSQCYFSGEGFTAVTPLFPKFSYSTNCNSNTVSFTNNTSGGASPYTYLWNFGGQGTSTLQNPSFTFSQAGSYSVSLTVKDSQLPIQTETTVNQVVIIPSQIELSAAASPTKINASTGSLDLTVTGGTAPYTFLWTYPDGSTRTTEDLTSLSAGTYSIQVRDALGCTQSAQYTVYNALTPNFTFTPTSCNSRIQFTDATLGGTPPLQYSYSWDFDNDGVEDSNLPTPSYEFSSSGTYPIRLTVTNGAEVVTISKNIFIDPNLIIQVTIFPTKMDESSGIIYVEKVTGGTPPYSYSWTGPNGFTSTSKDIYNLSNGLYNLTVTDSNGCTQTVEYFLDIALVLNIQWKSFEVKEYQDRVGITWEMSSEYEGAKYAVERSFKDANHFQTIGEISGRGSSSLPVNYSFTDSSFPVLEDLIYYRILLLVDEFSTYSPVKLIQRMPELDIESHWMAYPNPSPTGKMVLKYVKGRLPLGEKVTITAILNGAIVKETDWQVGIENEINLDPLLETLPPGLTVLRIGWSGGQEILKLLRSQ